MAERPVRVLAFCDYFHPDAYEPALHVFQVVRSDNRIDALHGKPFSSSVRFQDSGARLKHKPLQMVLSGKKRTQWLAAEYLSLRQPSSPKAASRFGFGGSK